MDDDDDDDEDDDDDDDDDADDDDSVQDPSSIKRLSGMRRSANTLVKYARNGLISW